MAYARRSTYRRKGRRGNRNLSTRRIFNNKGAKAQAKQIYALRKSVNRVARMCKPEVKVQYTSATSNRTFNLRSGVQDSFTTMPVIALGNDDRSRIGNYVKLFPLKINTAVFYEEVINSHIGYPPFSELRTHGAQLRCIAVQSKSSLNEAPELSEILRAVNFQTDADASMMMRMPFKSGITARFNILYNRVFTLSKDNPSFSKNIKIVPKSRSLRYENEFTFPKGHIWIYWLCSGLVMRESQSGEETVQDYNSVSVTWRMEQPFTDA